MTRAAAQAGFPTDSHLIRVEVHVPPDRCTKGETMISHLICHSSDTVDHVNKILQYRVKARTGRRPQLPSFELQQAGRHVGFIEPITAFQTLEPPDARDFAHEGFSTQTLVCVPQHHLCTFLCVWNSVTEA